MDCSHISAPSGEELLQFALEENSLAEEKRVHLEQCPVCQQRLAEYIRFDQVLVARFYRRFCPDSIQLSLYCEDLLGAEERTQVARHVLDCPNCALEVANTRRFLGAAPLAVDLGFAPLREVRRVFGVLTRRQAQVVVRRDEGTSGVNAWPRQYHAEAVDLSLHLSRTSNGEQMLLGILTSADSADAVDAFEDALVELYTRGSVAEAEQPGHMQTRIDDLGNLVFQPVASGEYTLVIHLAPQDVVIEHITIE